MVEEAITRKHDSEHVGTTDIASQHPTFRFVLLTPSSLGLRFLFKFSISLTHIDGYSYFVVAKVQLRIQVVVGYP